MAGVLEKFPVKMRILKHMGPFDRQFSDLRSRGRGTGVSKRSTSQQDDSSDTPLRASFMNPPGKSLAIGPTSVIYGTEPKPRQNTPRGG